MRDQVHWLSVVARFEARLEQARGTIARSRRKQQDLLELEQEYAGELSEHRTRDDESAKLLRARERDLRDLESRIEDKRKQLDQIRDNKEYQLILETIERLEEQRDAVETETLEALEGLEARRAEIRTRQREFELQKERIAERRRRLQESATEAESELAGLEREVEQGTGQLPPEVQAVLRRLRTGLSLPVVWLSGDACGGCGAALPQQKAIAVSRGEIVQRCQACGRYLVAEP